MSEEYNILYYAIIWLSVLNAILTMIIAFACKDARKYRALRLDYLTLKRLARMQLFDIEEMGIEPVENLEWFIKDKKC